jgi:hypothetical protein
MMVTASERALAELSFRLVRLLGSSTPKPIAPTIDTEAGTLLAASVLKEAIAAQNPTGYLPLFAPEVTVSTPMTAGVVEGRSALAEFLHELFTPFWEIEFMQTFLAERGAVMRFRACVKGAMTDGFLLAEFDHQSRVREFVLTLNTPVARLLPASA